MLSLVQIKIEARGRKLKCIDIGLLNFFTIVFDMLLLYNSFFFMGKSILSSLGQTELCLKSVE